MDRQRRLFHQSGVRDCGGLFAQDDFARCAKALSALVSATICAGLQANNCLGLAQLLLGETAAIFFGRFRSQVWTMPFWVLVRLYYGRTQSDNAHIR